MATLTAAGINCSNGQLDGFYTGTTAANSSYPIGSYIGQIQNNDGCTYAAPAPNANLPGAGLRIIPNTFSYGAATGTAVAGTWRARCSAQGSGVVTLAQRVA